MLATHAGKEIILQTFCLTNYFVLNIAHTPPQGLPTFKTYTTTEGMQEEAAILLEKTIRGEEERQETDRKEETEVPRRAGPKRIEILIASKGATAKRLVVTDVVSPNQYFQGYTVRGRSFSPNGQELYQEPEFHYSESAEISQIDQFRLNAAGSASEFFTTESKRKEAWNTLGRRFRVLNQGEITRIKGWVVAPAGDANEDDDETGYDYLVDMTGGACGGTNWTNRSPYHYQPEKPKPAHFRVSGDEVGAILHKEQTEKWRKKGQKVFQTAEGAEKKSEAETLSPGEASSKHPQKQPAGFSPPDDVCPGGPGVCGVDCECQESSRVLH